MRHAPSLTDVLADVDYPLLVRGNPVIIDDVAAAISLMNADGQLIAGGAAQPVRKAVLRFAWARGWQMVGYVDYHEWAITTMQDGLDWVVLDPLFSVDRLGPRGRIARITRTWQSGGWRIDPKRCQIIGENRISNDVGIADDASNTGESLSFMMKAIEAAGSATRRIVLCASSVMAQRYLEVAGVELLQFVPGDSRVIHLRDACRCLPFAGRGNAGQRALVVNNARIDTRLAVSDAPGPLWQLLLRDAPFAAAFANAREDVLVRFTDVLRRAPLVSDLLRLGGRTSLMLRSSQSTSLTDRLADVLA